MRFLGKFRKLRSNGRRPAFEHVVLIFVTVAGLSACSTVPIDFSLKQTAVVPPLTAPKFSQERLGFSKLIFKLESGTQFGQLAGGTLCVNPKPLVWSAGAVGITEGQLYAAVTGELRRLGLKVSSKSEELFTVSASAESDLTLGGVVSAMERKICNSVSGIKGAVHLKVNWQVFSQRSGTVVFESSTEGSHTDLNFSTQGDSPITAAALAQATRAFGLQDAFAQFIRKQ